MGADSGAFWVKTLQSINQAIAPDSTKGNNSVERIPDVNDGNSVQNQVPINPSNIEDKSSLEAGNAVNKFLWIITLLISLILIFIVIVIIKKKQ
jgi:predicted PurR-regulated permease PerM